MKALQKSQLRTLIYPFQQPNCKRIDPSTGPRYCNFLKLEHIISQLFRTPPYSSLNLHTHGLQLPKFYVPGDFGDILRENLKAKRRIHQQIGCCLRLNHAHPSL